MPSQALLLISRHYFPELSVQGLAEGIHATVTQALGDDNIEVVSAVVDEIPTSIAPRGAKGVSLLLVSEDELASIQVFVDEVNRDISLGRAWKSQGDAANVETMDDQWVPSGDWKALLSGGTTTAPSQTNTISAIKDAKSAIIISKPEFSAIDWPAQMLPNAFKYGLTPAKTPFLTGLPITMTHNKTTLKNGGFALVFRDRFKTSSMTHARLKTLGDSLRVSKAQGNILITLDDQPATYALLERIRSVIQKDLKISKDIQLYGQITHHDTSLAVDEPLPLIKIIAGDPGKGSIALSGGYRVREGDAIQLFYEDPDSSVEMGAGPPPGLAGVTMSFTTLKPDTNEGFATARDGVAGEAETSVSGRMIEGLFTGGSCSGFVAGGCERSWVHESAGSEVRIA